MAANGATVVASGGRYLGPTFLFISVYIAFIPEA